MTKRDQVRWRRWGRQWWRWWHGAPRELEFERIAAALCDRCNDQQLRALINQLEQELHQRRAFRRLRDRDT